MSNSQDLCQYNLTLSTDSPNSEISGRHCSIYKKAEHGDMFNSLLKVKKKERN